MQCQGSIFQGQVKATTETPDNKSRLQVMCACKKGMARVFHGVQEVAQIASESHTSQTQ